MPEELDFPSIQAAEEAREELVRANLSIDKQVAALTLSDGEPRGTELWNAWYRRAKVRKYDNHQRIKLINEWIRSKRYQELTKNEKMVEVMTTAKNALYHLLDLCKALQIENEELKNGKHETTIHRDNPSES